MAVEMSIAERVGVPLNRRCSRKCDAPLSCAASSLDPTWTYTPTAAERTPGMCSETTRRPPLRTVRRTPPGRLVKGGSLDFGGLGGLGGLRGLRGLAVLLHHRHQGELAAVVDLGDLDLELLADGDDVLDVVDALATGEGTQLADVQQAVLAGQQRDEGAEVGRLHHGAEVALADLGHRRVGDRVDGGASSLGRFAVRRTDVDRAVVLDRQGRARV